MLDIRLNSVLRYPLKVCAHYGMRGIPKLRRYGMLTKRGRPEFTDRSSVKSKAMTVLLDENLFVQFGQLAETQRHKRCTMARILIEQFIESSRVNKSSELFYKIKAR